jgi:hypothetical protein
MKLILSLIICQLLLINIVQAQTNKGIHFQAIARNENGIIIPNKQITIRITLLTDSSFGNKIYQEIKSVTTNMLGLLFIDIGNEEPGKVVTIGNFNEIKWSNKSFYLQVELDPNNALSFLNAGIEKINYVPLSLYADKSNMVESIVPVELGGTGVGTIKEILKLLNIDKVNNTPDSLKPVSNTMNILLNEKLKKADTLYLSNRINNKISIGSVSGSDIIGGLGYSPVKNNFGIFYDTAKQITTAATATAIKFNFQQAASKINTTFNTSGNSTRIMVVEAGIYEVNYQVQFIKPDAGTDELSIWIRKNSSAYPNTNSTYVIQGTSLKNIFTGNYFIELGASDYIELFYSVKNSNTVLFGTAPITSTPSRPATPSAYLSIHSVN